MTDAVHVTVNLHGDPDVTAQVLTIQDTGQSWVSLSIGGVTFHFPEYDADCVAFTRKLAEALMQAADELDVKVSRASEPVPAA